MFLQSRKHTAKLPTTARIYTKAKRIYLSKFSKLRTHETTNKLLINFNVLAWPVEASNESTTNIGNYPYITLNDTKQSTKFNILVVRWHKKPNYLITIFCVCYNFQQFFRA